MIFVLGFGHFLHGVNGATLFFHNLPDPSEAPRANLEKELEIGPGAWLSLGIILTHFYALIRKVIKRSHSLRGFLGRE